MIDARQILLAAGSMWWVLLLALVFALLISLYSLGCLRVYELTSKCSEQTDICVNHLLHSDFPVFLPKA